MRYLFLLVLQFYVSLLNAQDQSDYQAGYFTRGSNTLPFRYLKPLPFKQGQKYPVIIILHGSGERGNDNKLQLLHGGSLFTDPSIRSKFPAYVIFPQCWLNKTWCRVKRNKNSIDTLGGLMFPPGKPTEPLELVSQLLDSIVNASSVDKERIYIGGLSMGGMGTFELLWRKPQFFAAAFSICGGGDPSKVGIYKEVPIWIFHGREDPRVLVGNSRRMFNALKMAGGNARYFEYPGVGHNSWDNAFRDPNLMPWLFSKSRKRS